MMPEHCRAARGWLDLSQRDLAAAAKVSLSTVRNFENRRSVPITRNLRAIRAVLEARGILFVYGADDAALGIIFDHASEV